METMEEFNVLPKLIILEYRTIEKIASNVRVDEEILDNYHSLLDRRWNIMYNVQYHQVIGYADDLVSVARNKYELKQRNGRVKEWPAHMIRFCN